MGLLGPGGWGFWARVGGALGSGWVGLSDSGMGFFFSLKLQAKLVLSRSFTAHPTLMLRSCHFLYRESGTGRISRLKKDTEEVVQCSTNYHNVPVLPMPLQVFLP